MSDKVKKINSVEELARAIISWHWQHKGYNTPKHLDWDSMCQSEDMVRNIFIKEIMEWSDEDIAITRENVFTNFPNITMLKKFSKDLKIVELKVWNSFKENDSDIHYDLGW
mgnify:CR=1 FL=1